MFMSLVSYAMVIVAHPEDSLHYLDSTAVKVRDGVSTRPSQYVKNSNANLICLIPHKDSPNSHSPS